jgi:hypothetical protein
MSQVFKPIAILLMTISFVISCTDSPKNDKNAKAGPVTLEVNPNASLPIPKANELLQNSPIVFSNPGELDGEGSIEEQELKKHNLNEPIIYGVGAAGITMDTTFEEAKTLLTPPFRGPFANGVTFYNEQIITIWQNEGERKPRIIYVSKGYLGKMDAGKFKQLDFQSKFPEYKNGKDPILGAQKLIREFYLEFEQTQDKSYDCLSTGRCTLIFGDSNQANMVLILPGAVFLFAKEEFQLAEIRIVRDIDPGMLANNLDLLSGDIYVPEEVPFRLGDSYKYIFDRLEASPVNSSPEVYVLTDTLGYSWKGFWYSFHRSNFDIDVIKAEPEDITKAVQVSPEFPAYLTIGGSRILVTQSTSDISVELETLPNPETLNMDDVTLNVSEVESKLKMTTSIKKQNSLKFSQKFSQLLESELAKKYDVVVGRLSGYQNEEKSNKEIVSVISAFDSSTLKGVRIAFQVKEEQEKLGFFVISKIDNNINPYNSITLPVMKADVERKMELKEVINEITQLPLVDPATKVAKTEMSKESTFSQLSGFKLNDLVRLTNIDALGRGEATVELLTANKGTPVIERAEYVEQGSLIVIDENRPSPRNQSFVTVGMSGVVLGLVNVGQDEQGLLARVVSISSADFYGKIKDICGLSDSLLLEIGMKVSDAESMLLTAIDSKMKLDSNYNCNHIKIRDDGGKNFLKSVYFQDENLVINFNEKALSSVTIYLPLSQVQPIEVQQ